MKSSSDSLQHSAQSQTHAEFVEKLRETQLKIYRLQPKDLVGHFKREESVINSYRGRQILELIQNADDAGTGYTGESRVLLHLQPDFLAVANTGEPFSRAGYESLLISDYSPKQLERTSYIGNKGLGFGSVLSWTSSPLVLSAGNPIAFSSKYAVECAKALSNEVDEIGTILSQWSISRGQAPVPTMRFPFVPEAHDNWQRKAQQLAERGYDTIIMLPLLEGKYQDAIKQIGEVSGETALFCRHLQQLKVESPEGEECWDVERDPEKDGIRSLIVTHKGHRRIWTIQRRTGEVPKEALDDRLRETPGYEVAVAVPEQPGPSDTHKLCVFFPTADSLPFAMLAHASLDTDDNRKRLTDHGANRFILGQLSELLADVLSREAGASSSDRALALLCGFERCDSELRDFGFFDAVVQACKKREIFKRLDGKKATAADVRVSPNKIWVQVADAQAFPELLVHRLDEKTASLVKALKIDSYTDEELARRTESLVATKTPGEAGQIVGSLLSALALPKLLPALLRDQNGNSIPVHRTTFLPPESQKISVPPWAQERLSVLNSEFAEALRKTLGISTIRDVRLRLTTAGYKIEEFRFETLARRLEEVAAEDDAISTELQHERHRDVVRSLFDLSRTDEELGVIRAPVQIITLGGELRRANRCYFGPDYESHGLGYHLYSVFGEDEFAAAPKALGLDDKATADVIEFLKRLGVQSEPRFNSIPSTDFKKNGLGGLLSASLTAAPDLPSVFGAEIDTPEKVKKHFYDLKIDGIKLPDRFIELLHKAKAEALISFLAGSGGALLQMDYAAGAQFLGKATSRHSFHEYPIRILNPIRIVLQNESWVPCEDHQLRRPAQIILHRLGSMVFEGTFFTHAISGRDGLATRADADAVLLRLGAINSLETIRPADMYRLLTELPVRDPKGKHAANIYRSLLEEGVRSDDNPERLSFVTTGKMWGRLNDAGDYYPVNKLRYSSRRSLPGPVRKLIPLVEIDARRKAGDVERIFGVQPVKPGAVILAVDTAAVDTKSWSGFVTERFVQALPYLYAARLGRTVDDDGRDMRQLKSTNICVCDRICASVMVEGVPGDDVVFERELDGLVADRTIYLVSHKDEFPRMNQSFWRAIGDLFSEILDAGVGGDFAPILACESPADMRDLLNHLSYGSGEILLNTAQARLKIDPADIPPPEVIEVPPAPLRLADNQDTAQDPGTKELSTAAGTPSTTAPATGETFTGTAAPATRPSRKVQFSAGAPHSRGGKRMVQITDEAETIRLATRFEELEGRYVITVNHIHGYDGPRCDLLSVGSEQVFKKALQTRTVSLDDVERFIEVKGRNHRTGAVQLSDNELLGAEKFKERYFIYRVYCDPTDAAVRELAILADPTASPGYSVKRVARFNLHSESGAKWFAVVPDGDTHREVKIMAT